MTDFEIARDAVEKRLTDIRSARGGPVTRTEKQLLEIADIHRYRETMAKQISAAREALAVAMQTNATLTIMLNTMRMDAIKRWSQEKENELEKISTSS